MILALIKHELLTYKKSIIVILITIMFMWYKTSWSYSLEQSFEQIGLLPFYVGILYLLLTLNLVGIELNSRDFGFWQSIAISNTYYVLTKIITPLLIINIIMLAISPLYFFYLTDYSLQFFRILLAANAFFGAMFAFAVLFSTIFNKKTFLIFIIFNCIMTQFSLISKFYFRFFKEGVSWLYQYRLIGETVTSTGGVSKTYNVIYNLELTWTDIIHNYYFYIYIFCTICFIYLSIILRGRCKVQF